MQPNQQLNFDPNSQAPGQNGQGQQGAAARRLHIAHRRSPSEMTPLMSTYLSFRTTLRAEHVPFYLIVN